jgi:serine/threonine-protein kinase RsbT
MPPVRTEDVAVRNEEDVVRVRQTVRQWSESAGFSLVEQTKIVTAASELARNTVIYGGGGTVRLEQLAEGGRIGLRLTFTDQGPGIPDVAAALRDGFTTGSGLGLGLGGAKRLMSEFDIRSAPGAGTRIMVARWR